MNCEHSQHIQVYHDGELSPAAGSEMQSHLLQCEACRMEMDEMRRLSTWLAGAAEPELPAGLLQRLHDSVDGAWDAGILRIAEFLSSAAALILVGGLIALAMEKPADGEPTPWEQTAVAMQKDVQAGGADAQLATWMDLGLEDATGD